MYVVSDGLDTQNLDFGFWKCRGGDMGFKGKLNKFLAYLKCFQIEALRTLKNHQIEQNLAKTEEKPCSTCMEPIFWLIPGT